MKYVILTFTLMFSLTSFAQSVDENNCPVFTPEQQRILRIAFTTGSQFDADLYAAVGTHIGHSLAAIIWREAIVGRYIIRFNAGDGLLGSYGVGHVQLTTLFWMDGIDNTWKNRDELAPQYIVRLITDDYYAIHTSYRYLKQLAIRHGSIYTARMRYNGSGQRAKEYADDTGERVQILLRCGI